MLNFSICERVYDKHFCTALAALRQTGKHRSPNMANGDAAPSRLVFCGKEEIFSPKKVELFSTLIFGVEKEKKRAMPDHSRKARRAFAFTEVEFTRLYLLARTFKNDWSSISSHMNQRKKSDVEAALLSGQSLCFNCTCY